MIRFIPQKNTVMATNGSVIYWSQISAVAMAIKPVPSDVTLCVALYIFLWVSMQNPVILVWTFSISNDDCTAHDATNSRPGNYTCLIMCVSNPANLRKGHQGLNVSLQHILSIYHVMDVFHEEMFLLCGTRYVRKHIFNNAKHENDKNISKSLLLLIIIQ